MMTLFALYWRRSTNKERLPLLDISDYRIVLLNEETQCETYFKNKLAQQLGSNDGLKYVGFDCEWLSANNPEYNEVIAMDHSRPPYEVALLQLAFTDKECALVHLSKIGKVTKSLKLLLTDKR